MVGRVVGRDHAAHAVHRVEALAEDLVALLEPAHGRNRDVGRREAAHDIDLACEVVLGKDLSRRAHPDDERLDVLHPGRVAPGEVEQQRLVREAHHRHDQVAHLDVARLGQPCCKPGRELRTRDFRIPLIADRHAVRLREVAAG